MTNRFGRNGRSGVGVLGCLAAGLLVGAAARAEQAVLLPPPGVPPAITRKAPATIEVTLTTKELKLEVAEGLEAPTTYMFWTFNGTVPGPMIRGRVGDTLDLTLVNPKDSSMDHNIDLHAVTGPGGGAAVTLAKPGASARAKFKLLNPGLYVYHCAAPPVTDHIANGMFGMILVEPEEGLPAVDREYYVMQSELYTKEDKETEGEVHYDREKAVAERPVWVLFNGREQGIAGPRSLKARTGETVRVYFGNGGPNLVSSWHVIGEIFDQVWSEGGIGSPPLRNIQTTLVPAGGAAIAQFKVEVPGDYTFVDHSIFRIEKGAVGNLSVEGPAVPAIYPVMPAAKK